MGTHGGGGRTVAVLSDASDFHREPESSVLTGLLRFAALLRTHTGMAATALLVTADNAEELIAELRQVAPDFPGGIFLVHTDPDRGRAAQVALSGTAAVITDRQTTAVAVIAAALTTLAHARIAPAAGRLVIAGTEGNALLASLAVAAGIGEIDSWSPDDAHNFPLRALSRRGAVVIDLLGSATLRRQADALDLPISVLGLDEPTTALLALPGLLAAAQSSGRLPGLTGCLACALALVARTPPGQALPDLSDPGLADPALAADIAAARRAQDPFPVR